MKDDLQFAKIQQHHKGDQLLDDFHFFDPLVALNHDLAQTKIKDEMSCELMFI